ncbi:MAG: acyl-CoA thioesterase [Gammaproteobacteria bacterium]
MSGWIETYRGAVYPWHCDHVGHMNVMWYVGKFDEATWQLFSHFGITAGYLRENRRGMAALEQNIRYLRELHAGDVITVRSAILEVTNKVVKFVHEMHNAGDQTLAAVARLTGVHLDTEKRASCALPDAAAQRMRQQIISYES